MLTGERVCATQARTAASQEAGRRLFIANLCARLSSPICTVQSCSSRNCALHRVPAICTCGAPALSLAVTVTIAMPCWRSALWVGFLCTPPCTRSSSRVSLPRVQYVSLRGAFAGQDGMRRICLTFAGITTQPGPRSRTTSSRRAMVRCRLSDIELPRSHGLWSVGMWPLIKIPNYDQSPASYSVGAILGRLKMWDPGAQCFMLTSKPTGGGQRRRPGCASCTLL